jgi:hypothetical protein
MKTVYQVISGFLIFKTMENSGVDVNEWWQELPLSYKKLSLKMPVLN